MKQGKSSQIELKVLNTTRHNIVLPKRTVLGRVQLVQSVTPVEVKFKEWSKDKLVQHENEKLQAATSEIPAHLKSIDLEGLGEEQKQLALDLLIEEQESFAKNDDDIGVIPDLKLDINLTDKAPIQKNYVAVPKPLYPEVKTYIEDLLNRQFIRKSKSPYSSPVVCVRKKDQSLHLCVDYRALNQKTIPDCHPIPWIQESLDNLGGNSWFSVLDQGKAYHQGFVSEAFSTSLLLLHPGDYMSGCIYLLGFKMRQGLFKDLWRDALMD